MVKVLGFRDVMNQLEKKIVRLGGEKQFPQIQIQQICFDSAFHFLVQVLYHVKMFLS